MVSSRKVSVYGRKCQRHAGSGCSVFLLTLLTRGFGGHFLHSASIIRGDDGRARRHQRSGLLRMLNARRMMNAQLQTRKIHSIERASDSARTTYLPRPARCRRTCQHRTSRPSTRCRSTSKFQRVVAQNSKARGRKSDYDGWLQHVMSELTGSAGPHRRLRPCSGQH